MGILTGTQHVIKKTSFSLGLFSFRILSAIIVGFTLSLIGQGLLGYGNLSYWFVLATSATVFMKITQSWNYLGVFILNLILFLIGLLLRMYVLIAPGA